MGGQGEGRGEYGGKHQKHQKCRLLTPSIDREMRLTRRKDGSNRTHGGDSGRRKKQDRGYSEPSRECLKPCVKQYRGFRGNQIVTKKLNNPDNR